MLRGQLGTAASGRLLGTKKADPAMGSKDGHAQWLWRNASPVSTVEDAGAGRREAQDRASHRHWNGPSHARACMRVCWEGVPCAQGRNADASGHQNNVDEVEVDNGLLRLACMRLTHQAVCVEPLTTTGVLALDYAFGNGMMAHGRG